MRLGDRRATFTRLNFDGVTASPTSKSNPLAET